MPRTIIHLDLDAFFCSVEELLQPELLGKAFAVAGKPEERGVVASCSYPARAYGVRSAMPTGKAMRLCPGLLIIPGRHKVYSEYSSQIMEILHDVTTLVEQVSIDEAYLELDAMLEASIEVGRSLQERIAQDYRLPCSLGIASNKLVAKIANDFGKANAHKGKPPRALTVVPPGQEEAFLAPLPVIALIGVGPKTSEHLNKLGIQTIGDLAARSPEELHMEFGKNGLDISQHARGIDHSPVITSHEIKSISQEVTFTRDVSDRSILDKTLKDMADKVGMRLQKQALTAATVKLKIRWPDFTTLTRQISHHQPISTADEIYQSGILLLERVWHPGKSVRLIGIGVANLKVPDRQLTMFDSNIAVISPAEKGYDPHLKEAIERLREKFGDQAILTASQVHKHKREQ